MNFAIFTDRFGLIMKKKQHRDIPFMSCYVKEILLLYPHYIKN